MWYIRVDMTNLPIKNKAKTKPFAHKKLFWGIGIFFGVYIISLFTPFISNYTQFPLYIVKCGGLPLVANAGKTYNIPGTATYSVTGLDEAFFCTEPEAQAAGYGR
jgi:ABC-type microcin C transport system permease subunit YejE